MIAAHRFLLQAEGLGFRIYSGVPCSYLKPFINAVIDDPTTEYVAAANEGDAVAIAAGAQLGGQRAIAMMQNSGLGNAVNPLTSLTHTFRIPVLLIITLRGDPDGPADEPQHALMGPITTKLLETMEIPWANFPSEDAAIEPTLKTAVEAMDSTQRPFALVMRRGSVVEQQLTTAPESKGTFNNPPQPFAAPTANRRELLQALQQTVADDDLVVATTGFTGRELYSLNDRPNQIYLVGSMGCAMSLGLGLALACPKRRVVVIDGDGALLMRLGGLTTVGYQRPANLLHLVLDNECHESTGGQSTLSHSVDLCAIAAASGYPDTRRCTTVAEITALIADRSSGLKFAHFKIKPGTASDLPRPTIKPWAVAARLRHHIGAAQ